MENFGNHDWRPGPEERSLLAAFQRGTETEGLVKRNVSLDRSRRLRLGSRRTPTTRSSVQLISSEQPSVWNTPTILREREPN